jgi:hypothetical protein
MPFTEKQIGHAIGTLLAKVTFDIDSSLRFEQDVTEAKINFETLKKDYLKLKSHIAGLEGRPTGEDYRLLYGSNGPGVLGKGYGVDLRDLLKSHLRELARYEKGQQLLVETARLATNPDDSGNKFKICISNNNKDGYEVHTNVLFLNPWDTMAALDQNNNIKLFSILPTIHGTTNVPGTGEELVESRDGLSPYFLTIAHELTHFRDRKTGGRKVELSNYTSYTLPYNRVFPIIDTKSGENETAYYEHRAVLDGDPLDISELILRMEAGEPLRYFYQDTHRSLYEPKNSVMKYAVALAHTGYGPYLFRVISAYLNRLPKSLPIREDVDPRYTKIRLADSSGFRSAFKTFVRSDWNAVDQDRVTKFVNWRISPERRQKLLNSIEEIPRRITDVDAKIKTTKDTQLQQFLETNRRRLNAKLGRRINELSILQKMGLVTFFKDRQSSKNNTYSIKFQDAFKMLLGLREANSDVLKPVRGSTKRRPTVLSDSS